MPSRSRDMCHSNFKVANYSQWDFSHKNHADDVYDVVKPSKKVHYSEPYYGDSRHVTSASVCAGANFFQPGLPRVEGNAYCNAKPSRIDDSAYHNAVSIVKTTSRLNSCRASKPTVHYEWLESPNSQVGPKTQFGRVSSRSDDSEPHGGSTTVSYPSKLDSGRVEHHHAPSGIFGAAPAAPTSQFGTKFQIGKCYGHA